MTNQRPNKQFTLNNFPQRIKINKSAGNWVAHQLCVRPRSTTVSSEKASPPPLPLSQWVAFAPFQHHPHHRNSTATGSVSQRQRIIRAPYGDLISSTPSFISLSFFQVWFQKVPERLRKSIETFFLFFVRQVYPEPKEPALSVRHINSLTDSRLPLQKRGQK